LAALRTDGPITGNILGHAIVLHVRLAVNVIFHMTDSDIIFCLTSYDALTYDVITGCECQSRYGFVYAFWCTVVLMARLHLTSSRATVEGRRHLRSLAQQL